MVTKQPQTGPLGLPVLVSTGEHGGLAELRIQLRLLGPFLGGIIALGARRLAVPGLLCWRGNHSLARGLQLWRSPERVVLVGFMRRSGGWSEA